MIADDAKKKGL